MKGRMLTETYGWAHDVRNCLQMVVAAVSMLETGEFSAHKRLEYFQIARRNLESAIHKTDRLLINAHEDERQRGQPFSAVQLIREIHASFQPYAEHLGIRLISDAQGEPFLSCDHESLERVLCNLTSNAIQNTPAGGTVHIAVVSEKERAVFLISDTGCGIEPTRVRDFLAGKQTAGLGLSVISRLTKEIGGTLDCKSEAGIGTSIAVRVQRENVPFSAQSAPKNDAASV